MNYDTIPFHEILFQLGITGWTLKKLPNNEEEFLAYFEIAIPRSDGVGIQYSNDLSKFGVTWDQIVAKKEELETAYTNNKYQRDRLKVDPPIGDQLDMQYWDKINGTSIWSDLITKIKSDNPKE